MRRSLLFALLGMAVALAHLQGALDFTLGHQVGDGLLQEIGPRLQAHLRESDSLARLGGDEFAILAPEIDDVRAACALADANPLRPGYRPGALRRGFRLRSGMLRLPAELLEPDRSPRHRPQVHRALPHEPSECVCGRSDWDETARGAIPLASRSDRSGLKP
jgi:hypothetical protein